MRLLAAKGSSRSGPAGDALKPSDVRHFESAVARRAWLHANNSIETTLWTANVNYNAKTDVVTDAEALDLAPRYGWIGCFVGKLGETHYSLRCTRRRPTGNRSAVKVKRFAQLRAEGRAMPAGMVVFETRDRSVSEGRPAALDGALAVQSRWLPRAAGAWLTRWCARAPDPGSCPGGR
jgi:uncharacterized protein YdeI (YjbR/CyaY-like superfamily)